MTKVLLIEDNISMRMLLGTLLQIEGFDLVGCNDLDSSDHLIECIQNNLPDILILDIHLREINGLDILCLIRKNRKLKGLKILMTSGIDLREKCIAEGADDFLQKPYMPEELLKWLHSNSARNQNGQKTDSQ